MSRDRAYLSDILQAALAILRFTEGVTKEEFLANEEKYEAVNRKFEIMGEAARHLSPEARNLFPEIPWRLVSAMRNLLIHDYADVDLEIVWSTVQNDIPRMISLLESISCDQINSLHTQKTRLVFGQTGLLTKL
jgi:uncharacterized protein with HEPN domain